MVTLIKSRLVRMTTKFTLLVQTAAETFSQENDSQKLEGELCTKIPKTVTRAAVKSHNVKKILQCTPLKNVVGLLLTTRILKEGLKVHLIRNREAYMCPHSFIALNLMFNLLISVR